MAERHGSGKLLNPWLYKAESRKEPESRRGQGPHIVPRSLLPGLLGYTQECVLLIFQAAVKPIELVIMMNPDTRQGFQQTASAD